MSKLTKFLRRWVAGKLCPDLPVYSGWRLERSDSTPQAPVYFTATKPHGDLSTWTDDAERALQFARPEDAQAFAAMLGVKVHPVAVTLEAA